MTCSCTHPRMQLSETSFMGNEALEESDVFQGGVVSAPHHMTLHKVSMQTELLGCLLLYIVATRNSRWLLETSSDEWWDTSSIRESSELSETVD